MTRKVIMKRILALLIVACIYFILYDFLHPVVIVAVHKDNISCDILVENFPYTDKGKIEWWIKNKKNLRENYDLPVRNEDGSFSVYVWDFDKGYRAMPKSVPRLSSETTDLLCFNDMKVKENCIEKNMLFRISKNRYGETFYRGADNYYKQKDDGELIKIID
ncbi:DUF943 family protein [Erwinia oleae]|uniref:DUF943 family protein n=1 Tax=Erwinia oleae TaxID=796334 RepID=UPI0006901285|nr:DUF943 family protein [Erwinia oleae]